jgi:hypothetical protein
MAGLQSRLQPRVRDALHTTHRTVGEALRELPMGTDATVAQPAQNSLHIRAVVSAARS